MTYDDIAQKLMKEIEKGELTMTPRAYFTLRMVAAVAISVGLVLVTTLLMNFISFSVRVSGQEELLFFGPRGVAPFLRFFPWDLFFVDIVLVGGLVYILRTFRAGYRVPVLYVLGGLLSMTLLLGIALDLGTPVNDQLFEGREQLPPPLGMFYEGMHRPPQQGSGVCRCVVLDIDGHTLLVQDTRGATGTLTVILPDDDRRATTTGVEIGDTIFIAGDERDGVIQAFGIRKERPRPFPQPSSTRPQN